MTCEKHAAVSTRKHMRGDSWEQWGVPKTRTLACAVQHAERCGCAADDGREPEESDELIGEGELDTRVDRQVGKVQAAQRMLVLRLVASSRRQLWEELAEERDGALDADEENKAEAYKRTHPQG